MSQPQVRIQSGEVDIDDLTRDVEMGGRDNVEVVEVLETGLNAGGEGGGDGGIDQQDEPPVPMTFIDYMKSPIIELLVGTDDFQTLLTVHQALLVRSPFFAAAVSSFSEDATIRRIELANEDLGAVGCFLEWLYTGEYTPLTTSDGLDADLGIGDDDGEQLLKHARVYTLAEKLGVIELKALAHSKVHRINATARGELAYARFVYANTPRSDITIRRPIASFWGLRAYTLRHDAEDDFKALCLEYPEFGFDVLSYVLDAREKRTGERLVEEPKSSRKRPRVTER